MRSPPHLCPHKVNFYCHFSGYVILNDPMQPRTQACIFSEWHGDSESNPRILLSWFPLNGIHEGVSLPLSFCFMRKCGSSSTLFFYLSFFWSWVIGISSSCSQSLDSSSMNSRWWLRILFSTFHLFGASPVWIFYIAVLLLWLSSASFSARF